MLCHHRLRCVGWFPRHPAGSTVARFSPDNSVGDQHLAMLLRRAEYRSVGLTAAQVRRAKQQRPRPSQEGGQAAPPKDVGGQKAPEHRGWPSPRKKRETKLRLSAAWANIQGKARCTCVGPPTYGKGSPLEPQGMDGTKGWDVNRLMTPGGFEEYVMTMGPQEAGETEAEPKSKPEEPPGGTAPEGDRKEEKSRERKKERKGSEERERQRRRPSDRGTELGVPDHSSFCCSCEKGGLKQLRHKLALDHTTMITRTVTGSGSYRLAICLAPRPGGTIQAQGHQKLCGHIPCEGCTAWVGGNPMCLCCAQGAQDRGSTMQNAAPKADVVRKEPARAKATNPASSSYKRRGGEHPEPRSRARKGTHAPPGKRTLPETN